MKFETALDRMPLVAILRGISLDAVVDVGTVLIECGILAIETPLNSPGAMGSIERMASEFGKDAAIGAGTVLDPRQVRAVSNAGGTFAVSPNVDVSVIEAALASGVTPVPGFATPSEAFLALKAGAACLKLFPAGSLGPPYLQALTAVLPAAAVVLAVGGVSENDMTEWTAAGAAGFGIGSSLYKPGYDLASIRTRATALVKQYRTIRSQA